MAKLTNTTVTFSGSSQEPKEPRGIIASLRKWWERRKILRCCLTLKHEPCLDENGDCNPVEINCEYWGRYTYQRCRHCGKYYFIERPKPKIVTITTTVSADRN